MVWYKGRRGELIIATKVTGGHRFVREGVPITAKTIRLAIEKSLDLKTNTLIYQLHWPNRGSYMFGRIGIMILVFKIASFLHMLKMFLMN